MEIQVHYNDLTERQKLIEIYEAQTKPRDFDVAGITRNTKLRMLTDNFDPDWKPSDEPHGTMTFTDEPVVPTPSPRNLEAELDDLKARVEKLEMGR